MKVKYILGICIILFLCSSICCQVFAASGSVYLVPEYTKMKKGDEFQVAVNVKNASISACTLRLYFDERKVEYISEDKNVNLQENQLLYTWVDENGGNSPKSNESIIVFKFKTKDTGVADFGVSGEFYDKNGNLQEVELKGVRIEVEEENSVSPQIEEKTANDVPEDNSLLSIMRLNKEGISPNFSPDIMEYYLVVDETIDNLEVMAIPQNADATVNVTGNINLRSGVNIIKIEVTSKDKSSKTVYTINVTKTDNVENSNANLENLAVENAMLTPDFTPEMTQYNTEVSKDITSANILAIPQDMSAKVEISGGEELKIGDNIITIRVTAKDGITKKAYIINIHRRNEQEEVINEEEQKHDAERLSAIIEEVEKNEIIKDNEEEASEKRVNYTMIIIVIVIIVAGISSIIIYKIKKDN